MAPQIGIAGRRILFLRYRAVRVHVLCYIDRSLKRSGSMPAFAQMLPVPSDPAGPVHSFAWAAVNLPLSSGSSTGSDLLNNAGLL